MCIDNGNQNGYLSQSLKKKKVLFQSGPRNNLSNAQLQIFSGFPTTQVYFWSPSRVSGGWATALQPLLHTYLSGSGTCSSCGRGHRKIGKAKCVTFTHIPSAKGNHMTKPEASRVEKEAHPRGRCSESHGHRQGSWKSKHLGVRKQ